MKIDIDGVEIVQDGTYYRVNINYGTHLFHSEKLNAKTASKILVDLINPHLLEKERNK